MLASPQRPSPGTVTARVWEIADRLSSRGKGRAKRADVIAEFVRMGGNPNTANTQFQLWKAEYEARLRSSDSPRTYSVQVKENGRVLLPAELRSALGVSEGETLSASVVGGELRLVPQAEALRRARELVRQVIPADARLVDGLIEERRKEAGR